MKPIKPTRDFSQRINELNEQAYQITQNHGTERPFSGPHLEEKRLGSFLCVVCDETLFSSKHKYESGSGWPSFFDEAVGAQITKKTDHSHGMIRTEVLCGTCDAHLGHLFPDGPRPTGLRHCINAHALNFKPEV